MGGWRRDALLLGRWIRGNLAAHRAFLLKIVPAEPDITLKELAGALAEVHRVRLQLSHLHRALWWAGTPAGSWAKAGPRR